MNIPTAAIFDLRLLKPLLRLRGALLSMVLLAAAAANAQEIKAITQTHIESLLAEKAARTPGQRKMDSQLVYLAKRNRGEVFASAVTKLEADVTTDGQRRVLVDLHAAVSKELLDAIAAGGGLVLNRFPADNAIRASLPANLIEPLAARADVRFIARAAEATTNLGTVVTQGDRTHRADEARTTFGADGTGVKIGVLSDGVSSLAASVANGNLHPVTVLSGQAGSGNEGTAMLEIVQDIVPGSQLYFATAFNGVASFAQNIRDLAAAGCSIIVDDVTYFNESPFQDASISKAVNDVSNAGVLYFSSARNSGGKDKGTSGTWEGDFSDGGAATVGSKPGRLHNFGGALTYNTVLSGGSSRRVDLFWADPLGASSNDYDLFVTDGAGAVLRSSTNLQTGTQDPYESLGTLNSGERVVIVKANAAASRFLHLDTGRAVIAISTAGNVRGHNAAGAANAFSIAATPAPAAYPNPYSPVSLLEPFSSDGPRRIFFDPSGGAITPGNFSSTGGQVLQKPDFTAADGVSTSVSGYTTFYGTSAAAPHAAAIAGLLMSRNPDLTPAQIRAALASTALDIEGPGVDRNSGNGIVMAYQALQAVPAADPLRVSATDFTASGPAGGPFTPSARTYTLNNVGPASLTWSAAKTQAWTTVSPASGILGSGASATITWSLNAAAAALTSDSYGDALTFTNTVSGMTKIRAMTLVIPFLRFPLDTDPGWTRQGQWAFGTPAGGGGAQGGYHDPTSGATGTQVFGVNLGGDYSTAIGSPYYLTAGPFNFAGKSNSRLQFQRWLNSDSQPYVSATIDVSNNGVTWTQIWSNGSSSVKDSAWTKVQYDISAIADDQPAVFIRWGYQIGQASASALSGWNIDDIEFVAVPILQPPVINSPAPPPATMGQPFSYQITATGNPTSYGATGLPAGLSVNTGTGLISGTPTAAGTFAVTLSASNAVGTGTATFPFTVNTPVVTLPEALDTPGRTWITSSGALWFGQTSVTHDGVDAAASGAIGDNQESWLETEVTGPGTLSFWWKVSSEANADFLRLLYDGTDVASISGEKNWQQVSLALLAGPHTIRWRYKKDLHNYAGQDRGWVDEVAFTPGSAGNVTYVDYNSQDTNPNGSLARPYKTVASGYANVAICGTLNIRKGTYAVDFLLNKCLRLEPRDGRVLLTRHPTGGASNGGEVVFSGETPSDGAPPKLGISNWLGDGSLELFFSGVPGLRYQVLVSSDLDTWELWRDFIPEEAAFSVVDPEAAYLLQRFYKLVFP